MAEQLQLKNIGKTYGVAVKTVVLKDISLSFAQGEFASIIGQSGSGKSTLLNCIGLLDRPESGVMNYNGVNLFEKSDDECARIRNRIFGFIFQFHHLLPEFTALENVLFPYRIAHGKADNTAVKRAAMLLDRVGLSHRIRYRSTNLSGGQQQRVAIARSLMNQPELILADEPTGNLDTDAGTGILELMREINRESKTTFIIVTHDRHIAAACDRVITIGDGVIQEDLHVIPDSSHDWDKFAPCYCRLRMNDL